MADLEGFGGAAPAEFAPASSRTAGSSKRSTASAAGTARRSRRSSAISKRRFPTRPSRWRQALRALITFYQTGETKDRDAYDIAWVQDKASPVDTINGFVEVYLDARSMKGAWEALVLLREPGQDVRDPPHCRARAVVRGSHAVGSEVPQAKAFTASPPTPSTWSSKPATRARSRRSASTCRTTRRSASATAASRCRSVNVNEAYDKSTLPEFRSEFSWTPEEAERATKWSAMAGELTTNMHEVIGHGSGKVDERLKGSPQTALKEQFSAHRGVARRSRRAVFPPDPKLVELGLVAEDDRTTTSFAPSTSPTRATRSCSCARVREGSAASKKTTCAIAR